MNTSKSPHTNINPNPRRPRFLIWLVAIFAVLLVGGGLTWLLWPTSSDQTTDTPPTPVVEDDPADDSDSDQTVTAGEDTTVPAEPDDHKVPQYEADDPNTSAGLTGSVVRKTIQDGTLTIVAMIDQYLHSTGFCTLRLISRDSGTVVYTATSDAVADVSTSICEPFTISLANLPAGTYQIQIDLSGDGKTGMITDEMEVK